MEFSDLKLLPILLETVAEEGYEEPTPIQEQAIPEVFAGRDILGCAQTGTGKTAAFALPIIQCLHEKGRASEEIPIRALVVTPTRELASQVAESFSVYGAKTSVRTGVIFGGVRYKDQIQMLHRGIDVLVATPGRLIDLVGRGNVVLSQVEIFVLDEADRMLDMGFIEDIRKIIRKIPKKRQTLFFSATMPPTIRRLADSIVTEPVEIAVTPVASTVELTGQTIFLVEDSSKLSLLRFLIRNPAFGRVLMFCNTKYKVDRICSTLRRSDITAKALHSDKSQRVRESTLAQFKDGKIRILVATDIAARGIDVDDITHVINFDMPQTAETYVHRIGRTGRAGAEGSAVSFVSLQERALLAEIEKLINKNIRVIHEHPFRSPLSASAPTLIDGNDVPVKKTVGRTRDRKRTGRKRR
ncbi:MAG: DEAD/DEAH box helicase [Candidatus Lernaella stagnicola]|nr:DEAD/DEAH box helicase [Candidatus Lernaella stagnicola]